MAEIHCKRKNNRCATASCIGRRPHSNHLPEQQPKLHAAACSIRFCTFSFPPTYNRRRAPAWYACAKVRSISLPAVSTIACLDGYRFAADFLRLPPALLASPPFADRRTYGPSVIVLIAVADCTYRGTLTNSEVLVKIFRIRANLIPHQTNNQ